MPTELILLRHAEPQIQIELAPSQWGLSSDGKSQAVKLALSGVFNDVDVFISSTEPKAFQTAALVALRQKKTVDRNPLFNELNRDGGFYLTSSQYKIAVHTVLKDNSYKIDGWETATGALNRFKRGIEDVLAKYDSQRVLITTHGIVLTLFFSYLLEVETNIPIPEIALVRWDELKYGSWGIVKDNKVVKDIL